MFYFWCAYFHRNEMDLSHVLLLSVYKLYYTLFIWKHCTLYIPGIYRVVNASLVVWIVFFQSVCLPGGWGHSYTVVLTCYSNEQILFLIYSWGRRIVVIPLGCVDGQNICVKGRKCSECICKLDYSPFIGGTATNVYSYMLLQAIFSICVYV